MEKSSGTIIFTQDVRSGARYVNLSLIQAVVRMLCGRSSKEAGPRNRVTSYFLPFGVA
jgi:hypothetical protein